MFRSGWKPQDFQNLAGNRRLGPIRLQWGSTCRGHRASLSEPKGVSPAQRIKESLNEALAISNRLLFCSACCKELSPKSSSIKSHVQSAKYQWKKKWLESTEAQERDIAQALLNYNEEVHARGESLSAVYRVKVVTAFLCAAVPPSKPVFFREENSYRSPDLMPFVLQQEQAKRNTGQACGCRIWWNYSPWRGSVYSFVFCHWGLWNQATFGTSTAAG